jgi:hypothetical protein
MASPSTLAVVVPSAPVEADASEATLLLETLLDHTPLLSEIISYVGPKHYLFIASIDRRFQKTYVETYPNDKSTYLNASTIGYARICHELNRGDSDHQRALSLSAAKHGNLAALQYLHAADCRLSDRVCTVAALNGHLNVLQWCHENGCPWDEQTCSEAAAHGHLNVLQWCRENGCPWDYLTFLSAERNGHWDIVRWCRENGCPEFFDGDVGDEEFDDDSEEEEFEDGAEDFDDGEVDNNGDYNVEMEEETGQRQR